MLCVGGNECEICTLKSRFDKELQQVIESNDRYRLEDLATHLLSAKNIETCENEDASEDTTASRSGSRSDGSKPSILPILMKMKQRGSLVRQKKKSMSTVPECNGSIEDEE